MDLKDRKIVLENIDEMNEFVSKRIIDKLDATNCGYGNGDDKVESIHYSSNLTWVRVTGKQLGQNYFDFNITPEEILMTDDEWIEYCKKLKIEFDEHREKRKNALH